MSLKHQIKEEETLLAYFRQMLTEPEDEENYAQNDAQESVQLSQNNIESKVESLPAKEEIPEPQMQLQTQRSDVYQTQTLTMPAPKSLQTLLESVDEHHSDVIAPTKTQHIEITQSAVKEPEIKVQSVEKTQTEIKTSVQSAVEVQSKTSADTSKVQSRLSVKPETALQTRVALDVKKSLVTKVQSTLKTDSVTATRSTTDTKNDTKAQSVLKAKYNPDSWENIHTEEEFQTLFFTVQGVRFAVPLIDLGNIIECGKITQIFGKPAWYMGMTDSRGDKINIVDTLLWVKPEIGESPDRYPYLISLSKSNWALGCDVLEGNRTLTRSQVKWRVTAGSRPWLAGIVKDQMCALLHVEALISLFEKGMDFGKLKEKFGDIS